MRTELFKAWLAARRKMTPLLASERANTGKFSYKYADLLGVLEVVMPACLEEGLVVTQDITSTPGYIGVITHILHPESDVTWSTAETGYDVPPGEPRTLGSIITYLRRYSLIATFALAPDKDDDAAGTVVGRKPNDALVSDVASPNLGLEVDRFISTLRKAEEASMRSASTEIREGKKASEYGYMVGLLESITGKDSHKAVLGYILGMPVSQDNPPGFQTFRTFIDWMGDEATRVWVTECLQEIVRRIRAGA